MTVTEETQIDTVPGLSRKTRRGLASAKIYTVKDAINHSRRFYLKKIDNFTMSQYGNLATVLGGYGFKIPDTIIHEKFSVMVHCLNPLCLNDFITTFEAGTYQDCEIDEVACPKCGFHAKIHKITKVQHESFIEEESIWNDASRELSRLILNGYTIEDICEELSMDPLIVHVLNAIVPLSYETTEILKRLKHINGLLHKCKHPSEVGDNIVKGKQLCLMAKNLVSLGDVKTYTKEYAVRWIPDEDEVLRYLMKCGLSTTWISLLFPRTQSSIEQRYRIHRIKDDISYQTRSNKPRTKVFKEKRGINMRNINSMLTSLSETVFSMLASGKTLDEISSELGVDKNWVGLIIDSRDAADEAIYNAIVNDKTFEINSKNDIVKKTQLNIDQINVSLARLLSTGKVTYAMLWKRQLLPPTINAFYDNSDYFYKEYMDGCSLEYMSYISKSNPDAFRRMLGTYREEKNLANRTDSESDKNYTQAFSRNRSLLRYIKFIEYHFEDLSKDMSDISEAILHSNLEKLKAELVEDYSNDEQPVATAEPQEEKTTDDVVEKFVDIINESVLEAVKDPEDITDLVEPQEEELSKVHTVSIEEREPKGERPEWLRRKDEWTEHEVSIVKSMALNNETPYEISRHPDVHRTPSAVQTMISKLRRAGELPVLRDYQHNSENKWTDEQLSILKEMVIKGCTAEDISKIDIMKNRSVKAISVMISKLRNKGELPDKEKKHIDTRNRNDLWTEESINKLIEMHNNGMSNVDIACELNRTTGAVGFKVHMLRKEGKLPPAESADIARFRRKSIWSEEELETIKRMLKEGVRVRDILPHLHDKKRSQLDCKISELRRTGKL